MPIKQTKLDTDAKLTQKHKESLVEHRNHIIITQYKSGFTVSEIAFVFNLRIQNVYKIISK
jgi:hypothetical protein